MNGLEQEDIELDLIEGDPLESILVDFDDGILLYIFNLLHFAYTVQQNKKQTFH